MPTSIAAERQSTAKDMRRSRATIDVALVISLTLVSMIRLYKLGVWSFWVDEMFTLKDSIGDGGFHNFTYPLSYILIGLAMKSGGVNEWTARIVPCVVGILTPAIVYLLSKREFGRWPAFFAALLIAVSPWHLYWSQMARFYTMTMLFSAASALLFYSGYVRGGVWRMLAAALMMFLAAMSHYSAFLVFGALVVYTIAEKALKWTAGARGNAPLLAFYLPFAVAAAAITPKALSILHSYTKSYATTGTTFNNPIKGAVYIAFSTMYRVEFAVAAAAILAALFLLRRKDGGGLFLTCLIVVPMLALVVAGALSRGENRYALTTLPAFALLAGIGITLVFDALRPRSLALAALVPAVIILPLTQHSVMYFTSVYGGERWNYKAAAELIRKEARRGDLVLTPMYTPMMYYLADSPVTVDTLQPRKLNAVALARKRIWFVVEDSTRGISAGVDAKEWLTRNAQMIAHFPAASPIADYGVSVYLREPEIGR